MIKPIITLISLSVEILGVVSLIILVQNNVLDIDTRLVQSKQGRDGVSFFNLLNEALLISQ